MPYAVPRISELHDPHHRFNQFITGRKLTRVTDANLKWWSFQRKLVHFESFRGYMYCTNFRSTLQLKCGTCVHATTWTWTWTWTATYPHTCHRSILRRIEQCSIHIDSTPPCAASFSHREGRQLAIFIARLCTSEVCELL